MARARFIRPEFFTDEKVSDLPFGACMLFTGIWCHSDLRGVFEHNPRVLRGLIFPMRDGIDTATVGQWLKLLEDAGMIGRFEADGKTWGHVIHWSRHQQISGKERDNGSPRPSPPDPGPLPEHDRNIPGTRLEQNRTASPTPTPTPTATAAPSNARAKPPPLPPQDPIGDAMQAIESSAHQGGRTTRTFADWLVQVGHRCFVGHDERTTWVALFDAEGWDEMTRGYEYLAKKHPKPAKIFLSMLQEMR